jgi:predicted ATPase
LRLKGDLMLRQAQTSRASAAEECFRTANEIAREQDALFWELRIALDLARLRTIQGRADAAKQLLAPVYGRFSEGFETPDLRAARALLDGRSP